MKHSFYLIFLLSLSVIAASCHHPDDPPPPSGPEPGKRDYTWTIDTLSYPGSFQTLMYGIWASSPKDVYVVGHNDQPSVGVMYHYDGARWEPVRIHVTEGGSVSGSFSLSAIFGENNHKIYAVGEMVTDNPSPPPNFLDSSIIIAFDGTHWHEEPIVRGRGLACIWSTPDGEMWAGGKSGTLYHQTGSGWTKMAFDTSMLFVSFSGYGNSDVYATLQKLIDKKEPTDSLQFFLYHWNGEAWSARDSFISTIEYPIWKFGLNLWSNANVLFSASYGLFRWTNPGWNQLYTHTAPHHVGGSSVSNIFLVGDYWHIAHWNGSDWKDTTFPIESPGGFSGVWTNNNETFIIGSDYHVSYLVHGK